MTEEMTAAPAANDDAMTRRVALEAEATTRGIRFDKRFSDKRLGDMIAEHDAKLAAPTAATTSAPAPAVDATLLARLEALEKRNAELEAAASKPGISGVLTTQKISLPGDIAREESEKKMLMERCMQVGIAHLIRPNAGVDAIRDVLGRHMAERAQKMAAEEATARLRAKGAVDEYVSMRVLPLGDKKISRGIHVPGFGDEYYERGDIIENVLISTARTHEANGLGEIIRS